MTEKMVRSGGQMRMAVYSKTHLYRDVNTIVETKIKSHFSYFLTLKHVFDFIVKYMKNYGKNKSLS